MDIRPALPVAIDNDPTRAYIDSRNGEQVAVYEQVYTEYDADRLRQGFCCFNCGEAQLENGLPVSFPKKCWVCSYPMRDRQLRDWAEEFEGVTTIGSNKSFAQMRLEDVEAKARKEREREASRSGIFLPHGF